MNAIQFIRNYGIDEAREKIDDCDFLGAESFNWCGVDVDVNDLKRLMESLGYVSRWGGIERCKKLYFEAPFKRDKHIKDLKRYIHDYESIYGDSENA
ncbi:hypothetical protein NQ817_08675 [Acinetobacter baumannii]|nr:hypothetical protein [Acinetobacter baumannii]